MIRDFHRKHKRQFRARTAYDITDTALKIIWPTPPVAKPRGRRVKRTVGSYVE